MDDTSIVAYATTLALVTAAPGPLLAVLAARSMARDRAGAWSFAAGICFGDLVMMQAVAWGVGAWIQAQQEAYVAIRYAGGLYLLWLALTMWREASTERADRARQSGVMLSAATGFLICIGRPQTLLLYLVLVPNSLAATGELWGLHFLTLGLTTVAVLAAVFGAVITLSGTAYALLPSPNGAAFYGRAMALSIAASAIWIAVA